jgi:hypothetical protein
VVLISADKRRGASEEEDVIDFCGQQLGGMVDGSADCGAGCEHCASVEAGNANVLSVAGIANFMPAAFEPRPSGSWAFGDSVRLHGFAPLCLFP